MKFIISKDNFKKELSNVSKAIKPNSVIPAMECIKFEIEGKSLKMTATSGEMTLISSVECEDAYAEKNIMVEAKLINGIVSKINGSILEFETDENDLAKIKCGKSTFKLKVLDDSHFPKIEIVDDEEGFNLKSSVLKDIVNQVGFSASQKLIRPVLAGINLNCINCKLTACSTDSYRLSKNEYECDRMKHFNITVPYSLMKECTKLFNEENVFIKIDENHIMLTEKNHSCIMQLLDGAYPDVNRLMPSSYSSKIKFDLVELKAIIDRSRFVKNGEFYLVDISTKNGIMTITSNLDEVGSFEESMPVEVNGIDIDLSANSDYILQALNAFQANDEVEFCYTGAMKPFVFSCDKLVQLLLPVRRYGK